MLNFLLLGFCGTFSDDFFVSVGTFSVLIGAVDDVAFFSTAAVEGNFTALALVSLPLETDTMDDVSLFVVDDGELFSRVFLSGG